MSDFKANQLCNVMIEIWIECIIINYFIHRKLFKATIILVPLLGFTWIIGLFAVGEEGRVFAYLFVFANVFQVRED